MTKHLDQETTVVLDQAIYAKALEAKWKQADEFKSVVLRMGAFHMACIFWRFLFAQCMAGQLFTT